MELLLSLGLMGVGAWLWAQSQRIEKLSRRLEELERRAAAAAPAPAPEPAREALLLDQPLREHETEPPLVLDTPLPEAVNDDSAPAADAPVAAPAMTEAIRVEDSACAAVAPAAPAAPAPPRPRRGYLQIIGVALAAGALLLPVATGLSTWPAAALGFYICAAGAAAVALAALQRWGWAAIVAIAGLHGWFAAAIIADDGARAMAIMATASIAAAALVLRRPRADEPPGRLTWREARALAPGAAVSIGAVLLIWIWLAITPSPSGSVLAPALVGMLHVALAAWLVRERAAATAALAVAIAGLVAGFVAYLRARFAFGPLGADVYPAILAAAVVTVAATVAARPHRDSRALAASAGAIGAALLVMLAASSRSDWHAPAAWAALFAGAAFCFAAAWRTARDSHAPGADRAIDVWGGAAAALVLLGVESALPAQGRAAGDAAACLLFAGGFAWRGWRVLRYAALFAAGLALLQALSPSLTQGAMPAWGALVILALTTALLLDAAYFVGMAEPRSISAELLSSAAIAATLVGCFLALRLAAGNELAAFGEASWRALMLMAAGLALTARRPHLTGVVGEWRGHALIAAGLAYALIGPGLLYNPSWGVAARAVIEGMPVLNAMALGFGAPAALAVFAARKFHARKPPIARAYAGAAGVLLLVWLMLELRRAFHGPLMAQAPVGLLEGAAYALIALAVAAAFAIAATAAKATRWGRDLALGAHALAWAAVLAASVILLWLRHPWWGAQAAVIADSNAAFFAVLAQFAAALLALTLGRALQARGPDPTRFAAAAAAALFTWSGGHGVIRWLFHRGAMDDGAALMGVEGFAHALWPLALCLAAAALVARALERAPAKPHLADLQAIWAAAVWPALAFACVGLWFLFNPWWGLFPAPLDPPIAAASVLAGYLVAACLSVLAPRTPHALWPEALKLFSSIAWAGHFLVAAALVVRWVRHGGDVRGAPVEGVEIWSIVAVWVLFGVGLLVARAQRPSPRHSHEFFAVTPGARRGRRYGRRQRSS